MRYPHAISPNHIQNLKIKKLIKFRNTSKNSKAYRVPERERESRERDKVPYYKERTKTERERERQRS